MIIPNKENKGEKKNSQMIISKKKNKGEKNSQTFILPKKENEQLLNVYYCKERKWGKRTK